ncbi:hypothetical protein FACS18942_00410 [Planctomycetales bacterium]|nr:hypothetical protein FACS18942_00410 [Planctomycetales bacterium]GHT36054.1 hypothetical protein FACS189427_06910 [Planctomycetales bacterium]
MSNAVRFLFVLSGLFCLAFFLLISRTSAEEIHLNTDDSVQFFVEPESDNTFVFTGAESATLTYRLLDEQGKTVLAEGQTKFNSGKHTVSVHIPAQGFYEIDFPALKQRFGITALKPLKKEDRDLFFCIDGAMSWLVSEAKRREDYVKIAARNGIGIIRERLSWSEIEPVENQFNWEGRRQNDAIRKMMSENGIKVLEVSHDTPAWVGLGGLDGKSGKLPGDLIKVCNSWEQIIKHWQSTWAALEIWNEPDISFSGDMPADQYVPLVRAITFVNKKTGGNAPMVGGSLATFNKTWVDTAINCGILDVIDGFSFHTYARAPAVEKLYAGLSEVVHSKRPDLPFWLTECGRPWNRGVGRPPQEQDIVSACDIVMKGIEAKAAAVDYYFPFVYPYYDENNNNFAMMDRWGSPLRSFAAYSVMIQQLSNAEYLPVVLENVKEHFPVLEGAEIIIHRFFNHFDRDKRTKNTVLVLYTGEANKISKIKIPAALKNINVTALTGEKINIADDGTFFFNGGLVYLDVPDTALRGIKTAALTSANKANESKKQTEKLRLAHSKAVKKNTAGKSEAVVSPFAVVYRFDNNAVLPQSNGYHLKNTGAEILPLVLRIYNFDDKEHRLTFKPLKETGNLQLKDGSPATVSVPAKSFVEQTITADLSSEFTKDVSSILRFQYADADNVLAACPMQLVFLGSPDWKTLITQKKNLVRVPIEQKPLWRQNIGAHGKIDFQTAEPAKELQDEPKTVFAYTATFGEGDRWCYPVYSIPEKSDFQQYKGIIVRGRCTAGNGTQPRLMVYETKQGSGYLSELFPADGEWHTAMLPFNSLEYVGATAPDPNGVLDLNEVKTFSFGLNTKAESVTLEISDCLLYK